MSVQDPAFRFATNVFDTDGTDKVYDIAFSLGYIDPAHVVAMSAVEDSETGLLSDYTAHVVEFIDTPSHNRVRVVPVPATGRKLIIMRQTDIAQLLVQFTDGKLMTGRNLDLSATQLIMAIQEIMDGLRNANVAVEQQIGTVIDLNKTIQEIYEEVLKLLASGGIVSVTPRVWAGAWVGENVDDEEFPLPGGDVDGDGFYDTYVNGIGLEPGVGYEVIVGDTPATSVIRFAEVPAPGSTWFTVLRGYAKPYTGPAPITQADLRLRVIEAEGTAFFIDDAAEYALVLCTNPSGCNVQVNALPAVGGVMGTGSYVSIAQRGGPVTVTGAVGVVLDVAAGCSRATRGTNSVISLSCLDKDTNNWLLSGDLAKE